MSTLVQSRAAWTLTATLTTAMLVAACGSGDKGAAAGDTMAANAAPAPAATTAAATDTAATAAGAPITGRTVDVKMVLDGSNYRFEPASVTIHPGDGVRWTMVSGGPHNVSFWPDSIPAGMASVLQANMPNQMSALIGPLLTNPNATYTVSFANAKPGVYKYYCTPHLALGMKAQITVQ